MTYRDDQPPCELCGQPVPQARALCPRCASDVTCLGPSVAEILAEVAP